MNNVKLRHKLFFKIFAAFWLFLLLLILSALILPLLGEQLPHPAPGWAKDALHNMVKREQQPPKWRRNMKLRTPEKWIQKPRPGLEVHLVSDSGKLISKQPDWKVLRSFVITSDDPQQPQAIFADNKILFGPAEIEFQHQKYKLYISNRPNAFSHQFALLVEQKGLLFLILIMLSTPLCALLAWYITAPLAKLDLAAQQIAAGHLDTQLPQLKRKDEIGRLSTSLHQMVSTLTEQLQQQRRLLSDISHELRSPLTRLMMATGIAQKKWGEIQELQRIELEAQKIEHMIASLLQLTRLQNPIQRKENYAIHQDLQPLIEDIEFEAQQMNKHFSAIIATECTFSAYTLQLNSAIENICRNALRYAKHQVLLDIHIEHNQLIISIYDDGSGVDNSELESIFRPFYRPSQARERESGGAGLGLAIAANAAEQHHGHIRAFNLTTTQTTQLTQLTHIQGLQFAVVMSLPLTIGSNKIN